MVSIGLYQFDPQFGKCTENRARMVDAARSYSADILVFPELAVSGYYFQNSNEIDAYGETIPGPTTDTFAKLAAETGSYYIIGLAEKDGKAAYNSAVCVGPEGILNVYRKIHLFNTEKLVFTTGTEEPSVFSVKGIRAGMLVCFDHMFPEAARTLALKGAEVIFHPSNLVIPEYGQLTTRVRALENRVYWVLCNRTGSETGADGSQLDFTGESRIYAPNGAVLASFDPAEKGMKSAVIEEGKALDKQLNRYNNLFEDRVPGLYRYK